MLSFLNREIQKHAPDWTAKIVQEKKGTFVACTYFLDKTVYFNRCFLQIMDVSLRETVILHEVAHIFAGPENGHNEVWKQKCRELGMLEKNIFETLDVPSKGTYAKLSSS